MPLYEYRCNDCEHTFEIIQKFSDKPLRTCPECGGKVDKLISRTAFVLKGGGWYADGYQSKTPAGSGSSDSSSSSSKSSEAKGSCASGACGCKS